jgi:tRNA modification GTPase
VAAADSALAGLGGGVGREISEARAECLSIVAEIEARLDFDEDLPPFDEEEITRRLQSVQARVEAALSTSRQGQLLRTGMQVALVGRPNVGKSSLLNALSGTDRAIVTEIAGTTRDVVESGVVVGGILVTLLDTAGLRDAEDQVERIGVQRSVAVAKQADVVVVVADGGLGWTAEDALIADVVLPSGFVETRNPPALLVLNKIDLLDRRICEENGNGTSYIGRFSAVVQTSATTGEGLDELRQALLRLAGAPELAPGGVGWAVNERQAEALTRAAQALERVEATIDERLPVDFWTIDLRAAVLAMGEVSGDEIGEEVLNTVFSRFCIGK